MNEVQRGYGQGSFIAIKGKPNEYHVSFPLGNGKRSPKYRVTGKTIKSLKEAERRFEAWKVEQAQEQARGLKEQRTVRFYLDAHWNAVKGNMAPNYRKSVECRRNKHILVDDIFLDLDIHKLTSDDFQAFLSRVKASDDTKSRIYQYLRNVFTSLVEEKKLTANPIYLIKAKRPKKSKSQVVAFSDEDEIKLINYCKNNDAWWYPLVLLLFDAGLRQSELLGLCWDKVDFKKAQIFIHRTLQTDEGGKTELREDVKSVTSRRAIFLAPTTLLALQTLATSQGTGQKGHVVSLNGKAVPRYTFDEMWGKLLKSAGVAHKGMHACRHQMATRLLRSGCYVVAVSKRLGHYSPAFTLEKYSHAVPTDDQTLATAFEVNLSEHLNLV